MLLTFRLALHWLFFANDYNSQIADLYRNSKTVQLFWIHMGQLVVVMMEVLFNAIVLYNQIDQVKNQERITIRQELEQETLRASLRASIT
jgi:hypothetical protein